MAKCLKEGIKKRISSASSATMNIELPVFFSPPVQSNAFQYNGSVINLIFVIHDVDLFVDTKPEKFLFCSMVILKPQ